MVGPPRRLEPLSVRDIVKVESRVQGRNLDWQMDCARQYVPGVPPRPSSKLEMERLGMRLDIVTV